MSFIFDALMLWHLRLVDPRGTAPPRISQFLERVNNSPARALFKYKPTNSEPTPHPPPLSGSHTLSHSPCALITTGLDTRQPEIAPVPLSPLKLLKPANVKPAYLASLFLPVETTIKSLVHIYPLILSAS